MVTRHKTELDAIREFQNNGKHIKKQAHIMLRRKNTPFSFIKMFDTKTRTAILQTTEGIKNNAL